MKILNLFSLFSLFGAESQNRMRSRFLSSRLCNAQTCSKCSKLVAHGYDRNKGFESRSRLLMSCQIIVSHKRCCPNMPLVQASKCQKSLVKLYKKSIFLSIYFSFYVQARFSSVELKTNQNRFIQLNLQCIFKAISEYLQEIYR